MATGIYGIVRPSDVNIDDIDMYYSFAPDRQTSPNPNIKLNAIELLSYSYLPTDDPNAISIADPNLVENSNLLEGLYNLRLPATIFNQLGIYTIYIKPKLILSTIVDCGVLSSLPTINGIVIDLNATQLPDNLKANNALQGFKIEYLNTDGTKLRNTVRYVVTANKVVPVSENIGNTSQKAVRYRFDDSGTLMFLQLTPSSSSDVKPNVLPFIGNTGGIILISNTYFSPLVLEVEMVENTIDTLTNYVAGEQIKDVQNGILTYFDKNRVIIKQDNLYEIKDDVTNVPLFEVKEERTNIDETQNFDSVTSGVQ
ncbi:MAG: hypothetical protein WC428_00320 [Candidatus Paceibacterota bacterium]|jgi:hypothetical protein